MENLRSIIKNHLSEGIVLMDLIHNSGSDFVKVTIDSFDNITIKETSKMFRWFNCLAYSTLAALIARIVIFPSGSLTPAFSIIVLIFASSVILL